MREYSFLHADDEHRKLQAFGAVHGHEHDSIVTIFFVIVHRIDVRDQRKIREEEMSDLSSLFFSNSCVTDRNSSMFSRRDLDSIVFSFCARAGIRTFPVFFRKLGDRQKLDHSAERGNHVVEAHQRITRPSGKAEVVNDFSTRKIEMPRSARTSFATVVSPMLLLAR